MRATSTPHAPGADDALRVAVVAALSATTMLFASLVSAYMVRRSFADWRPISAAWPLALLGFAFWASCGVEVAARSVGRKRRSGLWSLTISSSLYLVGALGVIQSIAAGEGGLNAPHNAFTVMFLGVHVAHAGLGAAFGGWILRESPDGLPENRLLLLRLVTHFLTTLLLAIVFLLFVLR